jgi:hypothetical protein
MSPYESLDRLSFKDTDLYGPLLLGREGMIPSPAGGRDSSIVSDMKPAGGYISIRVLGVASCWTSRTSLDRDRGARFMVAIAIRVVALCDLSSMLIFVSQKMSCKSNMFNKVLG